MFKTREKIQTLQSAYVYIVTWRYADPRSENTFIEKYTDFELLTISYKCICHKRTDISIFL